MTKFLTFFLLFFFSFAQSKSDENIYLIKDNEVLLENSGNIMELREIAKDMAFKNAFNILSEKILEPSDLSKLSQQSEIKIENFVMDYKVQKEKITDINYFSIINVNFNPERINNFFSEMNIKSRTFVSENYLVLPVFKKFNTLYLWEEDNYWYDYLFYEYDKQGLLKLFFPEKSHKNKLRISAKQILDKDVLKLNKFLEIYGKKKALILFVEEIYNYDKKLFETKISTEIFKDYQFSYIKILDEDLFNSNSKTSQLELLAKLSIQELQSWWKKQIEFLDKNSEKIETFNLILDLSDLNQNLVIEKRLKEILSSDQIVLTELSRGKAIYKILTKYTIEQLNLALESNNIKLEKSLNEKDFFKVISY